MIIVVNDKMQFDYRYERSQPIGVLDPRFTPDLTPNQMLRMGVFEGHYMTDCRDEFNGTDLYNGAKLSETPDPSINFYGVKSRLSLTQWRDFGWIYKDDPRGWFQWYCRYYYGRRCPDDERQIKRWNAFKSRMLAQLLKNCDVEESSCRPVQRQALLQWAIDVRRL